MNIKEHIIERVKFEAYKMRYRIDGSKTQWANKVDFTPFSLRDWITRQHIINTLEKNGYCVNQYPNPFRLKAYKGEEEFIIDCPNTVAKPTPWGLRAEPPAVGILSVKWVSKDTVTGYEVTDIPNRSGLVGIENKGNHFKEMVALMYSFGEVV